MIPRAYWLSSPKDDESGMAKKLLGLSSGGLMKKVNHPDDS
jgi:hypothetical protein